MRRQSGSQAYLKTQQRIRTTDIWPLGISTGNVSAVSELVDPPARRLRDLANGDGEAK